MGRCAQPACGQARALSGRQARSRCTPASRGYRKGGGWAEETRLCGCEDRGHPNAGVRSPARRCRRPFLGALGAVPGTLTSWQRWSRGPSPDSTDPTDARLPSQRLSAQPGTCCWLHGCASPAFSGWSQGSRRLSTRTGVNPAFLPSSVSVGKEGRLSL